MEKKKNRKREKGSGKEEKEEDQRRKRKRAKSEEEKQKRERTAKEAEKRKRKTENGQRAKWKKHKFSPTTSQAPGFRDTKNAAVGKTAAFWLKSRAAISCHHRFTALIYEK